MSIDLPNGSVIGSNYYVQGRLRGERVHGGYRVWRPFEDDPWVFVHCDFSMKDLDDLITLCQVFKNMEKEERECQ